MCNYYTLRQDGSMAYMRYWNLQVKRFLYQLCPSILVFLFSICFMTLGCRFVVQQYQRKQLRAFSSMFQGSLDGKTWTNLSVHENDQTVCKPGQFASWPLVGPNALRPFRFFRVLLTGPTTDVSNPNNLCICFLELYGYFHQFFSFHLKHTVFYLHGQADFHCSYDLVICRFLLCNDKTTFALKIVPTSILYTLFMRCDYS